MECLRRCTCLCFGTHSALQDQEDSMTVLKAGQVAVVTGGATGIGLALVDAFARKGLRVVIADVNLTALHNAVERLAKGGATVIGVPTDVSDREAVRSLRLKSVAEFGSVDVLCNNAGIYDDPEPAWKVDIERWRRLFEINFWGAVYGMQEFVPLFVEQGTGHVLNMASMSGLSIVPGSVDYVTSKHGLVSMGETLRADLDLAGAGAIGVTIVCPSLVRTAMGERALDMLTTTGDSDRRARIGSGPNDSNILEPRALAEAALRGIEQDRLYVTPTPGSRERFLKRIQPILDSWNPC